MMEIPAEVLDEAGVRSIDEHLSAPWAAVLRRFRDHPHTTSEDTDGRAP